MAQSLFKENLFKFAPQNLNLMKCVNTFIKYVHLNKFGSRPNRIFTISLANVKHISISPDYEIFTTRLENDVISTEAF